MIPLLLVAGLVLLGLPGLGLPRRGDPAHWSRWFLGSQLIGFVLVEAGLLLWTAPTTLELMGATELAVVCRRMLGGLVPGDWGSGAGAGVASMALLVLAFRGVRRVKATQRRLRISSVLGSHHCRGDHDLVQLPTAEVVAYTVGGRRPQVVLSQGLLEAVGPAGVDAVCAHERVHVRYGHHRYLMVLAGIAAAFRWYPPAGRGAAMVRFGLERWADEEAGRFSPRGRLGLRNALLAAAFQPVVAEATGFGSADTVAARVRALTGPPPTSPRGLVAVGYAVIGLAGLTAVILLTWATRMSVLALTNPGLCVL